MSLMVRETVNLLESLSDDDKQFIFDFVKRLARANEAEYQARKSKYWDDVRLSIEQIEQGRGLVRELVEVEDDE